MVRTRRHTAAVRGMVLESVFEHPLLFEYIGKHKYLQMAVSKAVARAYAAKFDAVTSKRISRSAARHGYLPLLSWARDVGCGWNEELFLSAVRGGHIRVMGWLLDNHCPLPRGSRAFEAAARRGKLRTLKWLRQKKFFWGKGVCTAAAGAGSLEALVWLRAHGCDWCQDVRSFSAMKGQLDVLKWAQENGCPGNHADTSLFAARTGQLDVLKWMLSIEVGYVFDTPHACVCAAYANQLSTLQWLRANNAPWDDSTIRVAREEGHLELERWAVENGCPEPEPAFWEMEDWFLNV